MKAIFGWCLRRVAPPLAAVSLILSAAGAANAGACGTATYDSYLVSGFSCTVGNLTFSDFTYSPSGTVGESPTAASSITVTPVTSLTGLGLEWMFATNPLTGQSLFSVAPGERDQTNFSYTVTAPSVEIGDIYLAADGAFTLPTNPSPFVGTPGVTEQDFPPPPFSVPLGTFLAFFNGAASNDITIPHQSTMLVQVSATAGNYINESSGSASLFDFTNEFSESTSVLAVPELSSWAMIMLGFVSLGYAGRRNRRRAISIV